MILRVKELLQKMRIRSGSALIRYLAEAMAQGLNDAFGHNE